MKRLDVVTRDLCATFWLIEKASLVLFVLRGHCLVQGLCPLFFRGEACLVHLSRKVERHFLFTEKVSFPVPLDGRGSGLRYCGGFLRSGCLAGKLLNDLRVLPEIAVALPLHGKIQDLLLKSFRILHVDPKLGRGLRAFGCSFDR